MNILTKEPIFEVDVSPEMHIYKVLQHLNYGLETAFAEFIDNSIQSYMDNRDRLSLNEGKYRLKIKINVDSKNKTIIIEDNASGIKREDMERALKLGTGFDFEHSDNSLSVYGIGMKSSAIWFTSNWTIETVALGTGEKLTFDFNLDDLIDKHTSLAKVVSDNAKSNEHYTRIILKDHIRDESESHYSDVICPYVLETFSKFKNEVDIDFFYDGSIVYPNDKFFELDTPDELVYPPVNSKGEISNDEYLVRWKTEINLKYKGRTVTGFIMIRDVGGYNQPGIRLYRNNRVIEGVSIKPNKPETLLGTKNKFAAERIYGELNLDSFPVDFMKTNFNENLKGLYKEIQSLLMKDYNFDIISQAKNFRKKFVSGNKIKVDKIKETYGITELCLGSKVQEKSEDKNNNNKKPTESKVVRERPSILENELNTTTDVTEKGSGSSDFIPGLPSSDNYNNSNQHENSQQFEVFSENRIEHSEILKTALQTLKGNKPVHIYTSLCKLSLKQHSVLCYVGAWSFLEMFTALLGRKDSVAFPEFLGSKINEYTKEKNARLELKKVVGDISTRGNCIKHSGVYWNYSAMDLKPAFLILEPFLIYLIEKNLDLNGSKETPTVEGV